MELAFAVLVIAIMCLGPSLAYFFYTRKRPEPFVEKEDMKTRGA